MAAAAKKSGKAGKAGNGVDLAPVMVGGEALPAAGVWIDVAANEIVVEASRRGYGLDYVLGNLRASDGVVMDARELRGPFDMGGQRVQAPDGLWIDVLGGALWYRGVQVQPAIDATLTVEYRDGEVLLDGQPLDINDLYVTTTGLGRVVSVQWVGFAKEFDAGKFDTSAFAGDGDGDREADLHWSEGGNGYWAEVGGLNCRDY